MKVFLTTFFLLVSFALATFVSFCLARPCFAQAQSRLKITVRYSPVSNLAHQLDCVSEAMPNCSLETFKKLWEREFLGSDQDRAFVKAWGDIRRRYKQEIEIEEPRPTPLTMRPTSLELATKARLAAMQAGTAEEYFSRLSLVYTPADRVKSVAIFENFRPKFMKWWNQEAAVKGRAFTRKTERLLSKPQIAEKLGQYIRFFESELGDQTPLVLNLHFRPQLLNEPTSGQQIENFSMIEFTPKEEPEQQLDVVIHELCHFLLDAVSVEKAIQLQAFFIEDGRPTVIPSYNLLNEALASALGNGIIGRLFLGKSEWQKYLARPRSFYNNNSIDLAGKSILPLLDSWLARDKTLYDREFVKEYVSALEKGFGSSLTAPALYLSEMVLHASADFEEPFRRYIRKALKTASLWASQGDWKPAVEICRKNPRLNSLFIVHPKELHLLVQSAILPESEVRLISNSFEKDGRVLYAHQRAKGVYVFVIVEKNYKSAIKLVDRLADLKTAFEGVLAGSP